jgi:2-polyprenyl-6-methoxyphenol hydroxylase-like FAD-dependent oxidoreductase
MENIHVIISGAGPAGLTLALYLQKLNIKHSIIEKVDETKLCSDIGGGYDLGANALSIYRYLGLGNLIKERGAQFPVVKSFDSQGKLSSTLALPEALELSSIRRSSLQNIIIDKLTTQNIIFNSKIVDVKETLDEVLVTLQNGKQLKGDILVVADGVHSEVRSSVFKDGPAEHVGVNCMWGRLDWENVPSSSQEKFDGAGLILGNGQTFTVGRLDNQLIWATFWQAEKFVRSENNQVAKETLIKRLSNWNSEVAQIVQLSSTDMMAEVGIYDRPPAKTWHSDRTILIGDAAHPMTPFLGAGANTAIADAFILGHLINSSTDIKAVFSAFEKRRKVTLEKTVKTARMVCDYSVSKSKWKNWIMLKGMAALPKFLLKRMILGSDKINNVSDLL